MKKLSNISVKEFWNAMMILGLKKIRTKGGHEAWMKDGMTRPVIIQTHVNPIPRIHRSKLSAHHRYRKRGISQLIGK